MFRTLGAIAEGVILTCFVLGVALAPYIMLQKLIEEEVERNRIRILENPHS